MRETSIKRRFITFERVIKAGFVNFIRNITLSVAATAVMVVTLTIVLFSVIANATFTHTIDTITDRIDISVYLKDDVTEDKRNKLIEDLKNFENVRSVEFVSKDQALINYQKANQDNMDLLLAISQTDNPLPATIRLKPKDPLRIEEVRTFLEKPDIKALQANETSYSGDRKAAIDKITNATTFFTKAVFIGIIVFAVISMLIIFNTIQMAIFNRRDELTIMRLLGASNWYIKGPFIVETMIYGIVSAVVSLSLVNALFAVQEQAFDANSLGLLDIKFANQYFADNFMLFLAMQLASGIAIGAISALIATQRYLKIKPPRRKLKKG